MNIGELFLNLGIKGTEKTVGALSDVGKSLGGISSMSLEAKAGIVGLMYGFERLMAASGSAGTNLTNFEALTGLSAQSLQQWQFAARQAGESAEDFTGSLKGVQSSVNNMLLGKGAPEGLGQIARVVKDFDPTRIRDTYYLMGKLQEAAQKLPKDLDTTALKSFGLSEGAIAAMRRGAFTPDMLNKAPKYSDREIGQLDKANIAWSNLGNHIEMAIGHFNASHGGQLVGDFTKITDSVLKMSEAFLKLADKIHLFEGIDRIFKGWGQIFGGITSAVDAFSDPKKLDEMKSSLGDATKGLIETLTGEDYSPAAAKARQEKAARMKGKSTQEIYVDAETKASAVWDNTKNIAPPVAARISPVNVDKHEHKTTVVFQGHHDAPNKTVDHLKKQVGNFVKQNPAKVQGS